MQAPMPQSCIDNFDHTGKHFSINLLYRSAFQIAEDIKAQRINAKQVLAFSLDRLASLNPQINSVITMNKERALAQADKADIATSNGVDQGPLHGVPMTIKDAFCTEGLVTIIGMPDYSEHLPRKADWLCNVSSMRVRSYLGRPMYPL